ncbi:MAG: radical SAM protein [Thermodesulfobacteriota bacterium]|nr:radical SAM protein [Thermodesulfobacteriota bacterium]
MQTKRYRIDDLEILFDLGGRDDWGKFSFPVWYGLTVKINWDEYEFYFNLLGSLKRIGGKSSVWPNPSEWLKRTDGNDLIYYGTYAYQSSYDLIKNYYVPYTGRYDSALFDERPLESSHVKKALLAFDKLVIKARELSHISTNERVKEFLNRLAVRNRDFLSHEAQRLHSIIGGTLPVLPPDTIEVDYEVIPLMIMEGCSYNCGFCLFKKQRELKIRSRKNIKEQLIALRHMYKDDLINYNSLVLGQNDALVALETISEEILEMCYEMLNMGESYHKKGPNLFFFGGIGSFLAAKDYFFEKLNSQMYNTYINIGLESPDQETLDLIKKPLTASEVKTAFWKAQDINKCCERINITYNFLLGKDLPCKHIKAINSLVSQNGVKRNKGTVYLSPLIGASERRQILKDFAEIKRSSLLPVYLYLIQRL